MHAKIAVVGALGLAVFAAAVIAGSDTTSEAPPAVSSEPVDLDGLFKLASVPLAIATLMFDRRVNDVSIGKATAGDLSAAIANAGCSEIRRESEAPVLVAHIDCAGKAATVTFVAEGALAPAELDKLTTRDVGALVRVGDAMLAVKANGDESSALLSRLQRPVQR